MRRVVLVLLAAAALLAVGGYYGLTTSRGVSQPIKYWVEANGIGVLVIAGGGTSCFVASATESSAIVKVDVQCNQRWLSLGGSGIAVPHAFDVRLVSPLGNRTVTDGLGVAAFHCEVATCGEVIPPSTP